MNSVNHEKRGRKNGARNIFLTRLINRQAGTLKMEEIQEEQASLRRVSTKYIQRNNSQEKSMLHVRIQHPPHIRPKRHHSHTFYGTAQNNRKEYILEDRLHSQLNKT